MIRYSSFNYVSLLHSLLANVSVHRSREWGTIAAVVRRRPPWFIVFSQQVLCFVHGLCKICKLGKFPNFATRSLNRRERPPKLSCHAKDTRPNHKSGQCFVNLKIQKLWTVPQTACNSMGAGNMTFALSQH